MKNYTDKFKAQLTLKGLRFTPERRVILKEVFSSHKHFDTETLYEKLRQKGENISRATIYRTLPLLIDSGLVKETLHSKDKINYEHIFGHEHHDHMICMKCGRVIEFKDDRIEKLQDALCKKYSFQSREHRLGIKGYCRQCKNRKDSK